MKKQSLFLGTSLLLCLLLITSCSNEEPEPNLPETENPCRPVSVISESPLYAIFTDPMIFFDAMGTDTLPVQLTHHGTDRSEFHAYTYDPDGLPETLQIYDLATGDLKSTYQMQWWEKGKKKEISHYDESGVLRGVEYFDTNQNWTKRKGYYNGSLTGEVNYFNTYTSDDLLEKIVAINGLTGDTSHYFIMTYDSEGKRAMLEYKKFIPAERYRVDYSYDSSGRLIEEDFVDLDGLGRGKVAYQYLNGELAYRKDHYNSDGELEAYTTIHNDEYGNLLLMSYHWADDDKLVYQHEYVYECE